MKRFRWAHATTIGMGAVIFFIGCGGEGSTVATYRSGDVGGAVGGTQCTAVVEVGLYSDDKCNELVLSYKLDIAKPCSGWTRELGSSTKDNSATRFQCYKDRLCYTQYVDTYTCGDGSAKVEDKEARLDCIKDPTPDIWVKLLGGTDDCPDAPAGFQCPANGSTPGVVAACQ